MDKTFPYKNISSFSWWPRENTSHNLTRGIVDATPKFDISNLRIMTAGSCFAQRIARSLRSRGIQIMDYEPPPPSMPEGDRVKMGFGLYSARYGNIYSVRQFTQLILRAFDEFSPEIAPWQTSASLFVDPFRPYVHADGLTSPGLVIKDQSNHLKIVRRLISDARVIIFTAGVIEVVEHVTSTAVVPVCPGNGFGQFDKNEYRILQQSHTELVNDLLRLKGALDIFNPLCRIIFTVSPVPLIATLSGNDVASASVLSKSRIRSALDEVIRSWPAAIYFPSYEIATFPPLLPDFPPRGRDPTGETVDKIMNVFHEIYLGFEERQLDHVSPQETACVEAPTFSGLRSRPYSGDVCDEERVLANLKNENHAPELPLLRVDVVGDSHVLCFSDLLTVPTQASQRVLFESHYIKALSLRGLSSKEGYDAFLKNLVSKGILSVAAGTICGKGMWRDIHDSPSCVVRGSGVLILSAGEIDIRSYFLSNLAREAFSKSSLPDDRLIEILKASELKIIEAAILNLSLLQRVNGLKIIFLGPPPPNPDDSIFESVNKFTIEYSIRKLVYSHFDKLLSEQTSRLGLQYFSQINFFKEQDSSDFEIHSHDGVHINRNGARLVGKQLLSYFLPGKYSKKSWQVYMSMNASFWAVPKSVLTVSLLSKELCEQIINQNDWGLSVGNRNLRVDWQGNSLTPFSTNIYSCSFTNIGAQFIGKLLVDNEEVRDRLEKFLGPYTIICIRGIRSVPHNQPLSGPQDFHTDFNPQGLVRGILYLCDVGDNDGPFEYIEADNNRVNRVLGDAGTLVLFDANRFKHRASVPKLKDRFVLDMVFMPKHGGINADVVFPGMNHWPINPFNFSTDGFQYYKGDSD